MCPPWSRGRTVWWEGGQVERGPVFSGKWRMYGIVAGTMQGKLLERQGRLKLPLYLVRHPWPVRCARQLPPGPLGLPKPKVS